MIGAVDVNMFFLEDSSIDILSSSTTLDSTNRVANEIIHSLVQTSYKDMHVPSSS